jgi:putative DNA primase/helicase
LAVPQFDDPANKPTDFNDLAIAQGLEVVRQQVASAKVPGETDSEKNADDETIARLAALSPIEYDRIRIKEAEKLGVRIATLDAVRERERAKESEGETLQGNSVDFLDVAHYEKSVNGAQVLDEVAGTFSRYLVLPAGAADALALWVTQTHCFEAFEHVARLNCCSPDKQCGKTTTLDVTERFVARPLRAENITTAVLFRLVEKYKPTLLLDEVDTYLTENEELRGCLNSGHKRGGKVYRCEG